MFSKILSVAIAATIVTAFQAFAWGDMYMGDGTHNPNSVVPVAYHGSNYSPIGLETVVLGEGDLLRHGRAWLHAYENSALEFSYAHYHMKTPTHNKTHAH